MLDLLGSRWWRRCEGTIGITMPAAVSPPGTIKYTIALPLRRFFGTQKPDGHHREPPPMHTRTPIWSRAFLRCRATNMIVSALGRNVSQALQRGAQHCMQIQRAQVPHREKRGAEQEPR